MISSLVFHDPSDRLLGPRKLVMRKGVIEVVRDRFFRKLGVRDSEIEIERERGINSTHKHFWFAHTE